MRKPFNVYNVIVVILLTFTLGLAGCNDESVYYDDGAYADYNSEELLDGSEDYAESGDDNNYDGDNSYDGKDDDGNSGGVVSLADTTMTEAFVGEVYAVMQTYSFGEYYNLTNKEWLAYSEDNKHQAYEDISSILSELGFKPNAKEAEWLAEMDEEAADGYYVPSYTALNAFGFYESATLTQIFNYAKGIEDGKYQPLHPEILAAADGITVEEYKGAYLLCVGANHDVLQMTKEWTLQGESGFGQSGSVIAIAADDVFNSTRVEYNISGEENGKFDYAKFGETELLPVLGAIGAIDEDGTLIGAQIQISAASPLDAPKLFVLTQDAAGVIVFAVLEYSEADGKYAWDEKMFVTKERCCFDKDGNFCYIDESGSLAKIEKGAES